MEGIKGRSKGEYDQNTLTEILKESTKMLILNKEQPK